MNNNKLPFYLVAILAVFLALNSCYVVDQRQQALVFQFGEVVKVVKKAGLHIKLPIIQKVVYYDNRILNVTAEDKEVTAKDQKKIIVNAFAKYKIQDPIKFYQSVRDEIGLRSRLNQILESSLRSIIGKSVLTDLLTEKRTTIMKEIQQLVNEQAVNFGIEIIDVRILRADLPKENSEAIFKRMQTDREKAAKEFRAEGAEEAERIKSRADKDRKIILAEAQKNAEIIRGEGDGISGKIFADAFNQDPEFYNFYRSLQAYKEALGKNDTTIILSPDSEFLRYMNGAKINND